MDQAMIDIPTESTSLKRLWSEMSAKKNVEEASLSDNKYNEPIVRVSKNCSSTFRSPWHRPRVLAISPGSRTAIWAARSKDVVEFLTQEEFDWRSVSTLRIQDLITGVFRVTIDVEGGDMAQKHRWQELSVTICKLLHWTDCMDMKVEFCIDDGSSDLRIFAVPSDHPLVTTWPQLRLSIIKLLQGYDWETIDVLLRTEHLRSKAVPTVSVSLRDVSRYD